MGMKKLYRGAVGTGSGTLLYTTPAGFTCDIVDIAVANTTSGALTFKLHIVTSGGSADTSNLMFPDVSIPANTLVQWTGQQRLNPGDFIQGVGSGSGITVMITGQEIRL